jgi:hypothetical protein
MLLNVDVIFNVNEISMVFLSLQCVIFANNVNFWQTLRA